MLMIERSQILSKAEQNKTTHVIDGLCSRAAARRLGSSDEAGFAAIIIAMVLVLVLSLVTIGFAALMRNEQRSALDRQLSNAAYYAAESGINDAAAAVRAGFTLAKQQCAGYTGAQIGALSGGTNKAAATQYLKDTNMTVDSSSQTSYSCLLINPNPSTLEYSAVPTAQPTTVVITGVNSAGNDTPIDKLVFSWQDASGGKIFAPYDNVSNPGCPAYNASSLFPSTGCWTRGGTAITGVLRVGLTPMDALDRASLERNQYTAFLYPLAGAAGAPPQSQYSTNIGQQAGAIINGSCNNNNSPRYCNVAVTNAGTSTTTYLLHLSSIYQTTQVTITAYNNGTPLNIRGAQTLIDSTGKAQDVLRRIQVRLPLRNNYDYPEFDIATSGNVCKQLSTYPANNSTATPGNTTLGSCSGL